LCMALVSDASGTPRAGFALATGFSTMLLAGLLVNAIRDPSRQRLHDADGARQAG